MDTQNTPIHVKLWHREFWMMAIANLLMMMSVYMLIPTLPSFLLEHGYCHLEVSVVMGVYAVGLYVLGGFCSYLVQHYRRNRVCQYAIIAVILCLGVLYYACSQLCEQQLIEVGVFCGLRLLLGASLGLAQMTLCSTLIIDTCESFQRTEANHASAWFSRFGLSLGPLMGIVAFRDLGYEWAFAFSCLCALVSLLLITIVKFPFKAPADNFPKFSLDRFFLPQGMPLFLNLLIIMFVVGLFLSHVQRTEFYAMMMGGFLLALLAERFVFANADLKSEILSGLVLMIAADMILLFSHHTVGLTLIVPTLLGFGVGIIGSRFLLFFIKLAKHCQRGTSQSTFFLSWETGLALGLCAGYVLQESRLVVALCLLVVCLLLYNFMVHPWYMKHKNR